MQKQVHNIAPLYDDACRILILGSFPSPKTRQAGFFYGHPQNRFWPLMAAVLAWPLPANVKQKRVMLLQNHIALWDVLQSCQIEGAQDASIRDARANDLSVITNNAPIEQIFVNGSTAYDYYRRLCQPQLGRPAVKLPSSSPANAQYSLSRLIDEWQTALSPYLTKNAK